MQSSPRILLISTYFDANLPSGGVLYSIDLAREWLARGRSVAVLCADLDRSLGDLQPFVESGALELHPLISTEDVRFTHHPNTRLEQRTREFIHAYEPDLIHVHNWQGMLSAVTAAVDSETPVIYTALDFGLLCFNFYLDDGSASPCTGPESASKCAACVGHRVNGPARWLAPMLPRRATRAIWPRYVKLDQVKSSEALQERMRHVLRHVDAVIAPSPIMADRLIAYGTPAHRVHHIGYGLNAGKILRPEKSESPSLRLGFFGGVAPIKGLQVLTDAASRLPNGLPLEIRVFGVATAAGRVPSYDDTAKQYLVHVPAVFGKALADAHADLDAVLVPSQWHENAPFVVLESLANGTPVIAANQAGIAHLVTPGQNGWLLSPSDPDAWAAAMIRAAQHPGTLRRMRPGARYERTLATFADDVDRVEHSMRSIEKMRTPARIIPQRVQRVMQP